MSSDKNIVPLDTFLHEISTSLLYPQLVIQLQKDVMRAGIDHVIDPDVTPASLVLELQTLLLSKLRLDFNQYLNLLYAVDVSENELRDFSSENIEDIAIHASYLILKREWKKIWLRHNL
ncbi:hypothetical protein [Aquimarina sp. AU474]|uniref:hypothetical protein n=1 Tax=Aquimarina sp. AU474 TaxID=2108529 RepID=UPI000D69F126|nr:hypothetical protein [Aquimarina sp. AU474]